jgi:hypothetical protein
MTNGVPRLQMAEHLRLRADSASTPAPAPQPAVIP